MMMTDKDLKSRFGVHKATVEGPAATAPKHAELRRLFLVLAVELDCILADGREKSIAFTELENASMWSHKALAKTAPLIED